MAVGISEKRINVSDMYWVIHGLLMTYGEGIQTAVNETSRIVAKGVAKDLRKAGTFKGGKDFKSGWSFQRRRLAGLGEIWTVYNKKKPGLAHLLEFGHAKQNGGRTKAFNFIAPIADTVEERFRETFVDVMADTI